MNAQMSPVETERGSRQFNPPAEGWRSHVWAGGRFDTAYRPVTASVEGEIIFPWPTIMATVEGGTRLTEIASECGHRYSGADFPGAVSFVRAGTARRIKMRDVRTAWVSLSLRSDLFMDVDSPTDSGCAVAAFTNRPDSFLTALLRELRRQSGVRHGLDPLYCETMAIAAMRYLGRRYGEDIKPASLTLPNWRLQRAKDYIHARLYDRDLRIDDIANAIGLSSGFFHRSFKATTGETPLGYIQRQRVQCALQFMENPDLSIAAVALRVGFWSPSHFARLFRRQVGMTPSHYRAGRR